MMIRHDSRLGCVCVLYFNGEGLDFCPILLPKNCSDLILTPFLSRDRILKLDLMLILDSNSKFRNYLLNLDIHNFTLVPHKLSPHMLGYPGVTTPLGDALE